MEGCARLLLSRSAHAVAVASTAPKNRWLKALLFTTALNAVRGGRRGGICGGARVDVVGVAKALMATNA